MHSPPISTDVNEPTTGDIYNNVLGHVPSCGGENGNPNPNVWGKTASRQVYNDLEPKKEDVQKFTHYLFVRGDLVLDLPHNSGKGTIQKVFVLFLGVRLVN